MRHDNRDYIIQQADTDAGVMNGVVNILLLLFAVCVVGVVLNMAWEAIEPYYLVAVEWRDAIVGWFQSVFG